MGRISGASGQQKIKEVIPTDGNNPSIALAYTGSNLTTITKTIGTTDYQKTLTWTDGVLTAVSSWSAV